MELKFIGQGLDPTSDATAGNLIIDSLTDEQFNSFNAFVAFVSIGGINNIIDQLTAFKERGGAIRLYVGVDLNGTSKEALEKLIELELETYIVFSPNNIIYHPKIYTFVGDTFSRAVVGSSNLTEEDFSKVLNLPYASISITKMMKWGLNFWLIFMSTTIG